ncbi:hypothetical protein N9045_01805 [bacterium]|nr:hypothetical protein [bacterium]
MDNQIKALLLNVDLRWRDCDDGIGQTHDPERQERLTQALDRLTLHTDGLRPDTLSKMLDSGEEVIEWLAEHPKAKVGIGYWCVDITSPEFSDVDWERFDWPFGLNGAVEEFSKGWAPQSGEEWECCWSLG